MAEVERILIETEDFLARQLGSRAGRTANKQRLQRGVGEAMRRVRRAALIFVGLIFALIAASIAGASIGFLVWIIALPAIFLAALLSLTFPTLAGRRRAQPALSPAEAVQKMPLDALTGRCEQWLLDRTADLPRAALPAADRILERLHALQPALAGLPDTDPLAGEARRLVGGHLPRLIDTYLDLGPEQRAPNDENSRRLAEGLDIVAGELTDLCGRIDGCREASFATQHRFIESRYRDGGPSA